MILRDLFDRGKLQAHKTSREEIYNLFEVIRRDLRDARVDDLSTDRRFSAVYNAVLQTATVLLYSEGYRTRGFGHHFHTFQAAKYILGAEFSELINYFDDCRVKRNRTFYDQAGIASEKEVAEFIEESERFFEIIRMFLEKNHPDLLKM